MNLFVDAFSTPLWHEEKHSQKRHQTWHNEESWWILRSSPRAWNPYGIHEIWLTIFHPKCSDFSQQQLGEKSWVPSAWRTRIFWKPGFWCLFEKFRYDSHKSMLGLHEGGPRGPLENHQEFPSPVWLSEGGNVWLKVETQAVVVPWFHRNTISRPWTNPVTILMNSEIGKNQKLL